MPVREVYDGTTGDLVETWDDDARIFTDHRSEPDETRPYTEQENAEVDTHLAEQEQAQEHAETQNRVRAIITDLQAEKDRAQAVLDTPNATINSSPAKYVKDGAQSNKRIADAVIDLAKYVDGR